MKSINPVFLKIALRSLSGISLLHASMPIESGSKPFHSVNPQENAHKPTQGFLKDRRANGLDLDVFHKG
jgi:hypothetical protein